MTAKKNSLDKKFRKPLGMEEPLVFDAFNTSTEIKGLEPIKPDLTEASNGDSEVIENIKEKTTGSNRGGVKVSSTAVPTADTKFSAFEDYKNDPGKKGGTVTKTFTLDEEYDVKLSKISTALNASLRVIFSNLIDEFYNKYEKDIQKQIKKKYNL